jgi:TPR repeat protein
MCVGSTLSVSYFTFVFLRRLVYAATVTACALHRPRSLAVMYIRGKWMAEEEDFVSGGLNITADDYTALRDELLSEQGGEAHDESTHGESAHDEGVHDEGVHAALQQKLNHKLAFLHLRKASELGVQSSYRNLGVSYLNGLGTSANMTEVEKWYKVSDEVVQGE